VPARAHESQRDGRLRGRGVDGVGEEIADEALDEHFIHLDLDVGNRIDRNGDRFSAQARLGKFHGLRQYEVEPRDFELGRVVLRKEERFLNVGLHGANVAQRDREKAVDGLGIGESARAELEQRRDGREEIVQVMRHAARHAAEEFEFLRDEDFVLEPDLIEDQAEVFRELDEQMQIERGVRFVGRLFSQQQNSEWLLVENHRETELRIEDLQLAARLKFRFGFTFRRVSIVDREVIHPPRAQHLEDREVARQLVQPRPRLLGARHADGRPARDLVEQNDLVAAGLQRVREKFIEILDQQLVVGIPRHRIDERLELVVVLEAPAEPARFESVGRRGAAQRRRKQARRHDRARHEHRHRHDRPKRADVRGKQRARRKEQRELEHQQHRQPQRAPRHAAERNLDVQQLIQQRAVGDDEPLENRRETAKRVDAPVGERIMIDAQDRQEVVVPEKNQDALRP
jgi:hypothetical protein